MPTRRAVARRQYHKEVPAGSGDRAGFDPTRYTYDRKDQLTTVTDDAGNVWRYEYDLRGRMKLVSDPDKGTAKTTFNDAGDV